MQPIVKGFLFAVLGSMGLPSSAYARISAQRAEELVAMAVNEFAADLAERYALPPKINYVWDSPLFMAYGGPDRDGLSFGFYGGLLAGEANEGSFLATVCHELGHALGGYPERVPYAVAHSSVEGQADYFATSKCLRRLLATPGVAQDTLADKPVPLAVARPCSLAFADQPLEVGLCIRSLVAVELNFRLMYKDLTLSYEAADPAMVASTTMTYPSPQCRLDSAKAGALCHKSAWEGFSFVDPSAGACGDEQPAGARPRCWFAPDATPASKARGPDL